MTDGKGSNVPASPAQTAETGSSGGKGTEGQAVQSETQDRGSSVSPASPPSPRRAHRRSSIQRRGRAKAGAQKSPGRQMATSGAKRAAGESGSAPQAPKRARGNRHDWNAIRTRYIIGNESLREIAEKIPCSNSNIMTRSRKEGWPKLREEYRRDLDAKTVQKATDEAATERAKLAKIAVGGMGVISIKIKRVLWKMNHLPPEEWEKDPEIAKFASADFERYAKIYLLLSGEPTERHEIKEKMTPDTAAAIWRLMAKDQEQKEGED